VSRLVASLHARSRPQFGNRRLGRTTARRESAHIELYSKIAYSMWRSHIWSPRLDEEGAARRVATRTKREGFAYRLLVAPVRVVRRLLRRVGNWLDTGNQRLGAIAALIAIAFAAGAIVKWAVPHHSGRASVTLADVEVNDWIAEIHHYDWLGQPDIFSPSLRYYVAHFNALDTNRSHAHGELPHPTCVSPVHLARNPIKFEGEPIDTAGTVVTALSAPLRPLPTEGPYHLLSPSGSPVPNQSQRVDPRYSSTTVLIADPLKAGYAVEVSGTIPSGLKIRRGYGVEVTGVLMGGGQRPAINPQRPSVAEAIMALSALRVAPLPPHGRLVEVHPGPHCH
jgi:hypothetical protein